MKLSTRQSEQVTRASLSVEESSTADLEAFDQPRQAHAGVATAPLETIGEWGRRSAKNMPRIDYDSGSTKIESHEWVENSTTEEEYPQGIENRINTLFKAAVKQDFEDGMESEFSRELLTLIRKYSSFAIAEIAYLITRERINSEVSAEALLWLGDMDHPATYKYRLWLLEKSISHSSARVRDRAILGLSFMADPHAIPYIEKAIDQEKCSDLFKYMEHVLKELKVDNRVSSTKDKHI